MLSVIVFVIAGFLIGWFWLSKFPWWVSVSVGLVGLAFILAANGC